jgi:hypothetical protein
MGARLGDMLDMRFVVDEQDRVDVPPALVKALAADPALQATWLGLTPGQRRRHAYQVEAAKSSATVLKRLQAVLDALAGGTAGAQPNGAAPDQPAESARGANRFTTLPSGSTTRAKR